MLHAVRRLDDTATIQIVRDSFAERLGEDMPAVMLLDVKLGEADEALPAFVAAHQTTADAELAAWVAWAGAVLGSAVALEHLDRIVGQAASGRTSVAIMLASVQLDHADVGLRIASSALNRARMDVRSALHLAHAQALAAAGRIEEAVAALYSVPADTALVATITPPLAPDIQQATGYPPLVEHIVTG